MEQTDKVQTLFLIDILCLRDVNAVYGFDNGNEMIAQVNNLLKLFLSDETNPIYKYKISFSNIYLDIFSLQINENITYNTLLEIKDCIFNKIITHKFILKDVDVNINLNVTIGCSQSSCNHLQVYAEKALQYAKRNFLAFMYFDPKYYNSETLNIDLLSILKYNIDEKLVEPYLQAVLCNKTSKIVKYEALMRIFDKDGTMLLPRNFIDKARRYRVYTQLILILIEKVISYIEEHKLHISINLDFNDIVNPVIKNYIIGKLEGNNLGSYLTIEILESTEIHNFELVNDFIQEVKKYNVKIAIDDFGTGFSNYDFILKLNIDYIKIDGSLIKKIDEKRYSNLIKSIVYFCKEQDIGIVAEFVSDLKMLRYVKALGIDYSQGYFISKPKPLINIIGDDYEK